MFPAAWLAMFETVLGANDPDGDGYPSGPGMVEVEGMGEETLDSAAYTWQALGALSSMAIALGETEKAEMAARRAGVIAARFDADWWEEDSGVYAMSLDTPGNVRAHVPHWAVIVPLEVGLASTEYARRTFTSLRAHFLNRWGLKHTVGEDERVWTLPTALLSRAAYRYGEPELGAAMLKNIAAVLQAGSIGLFHELIPEGACFVQLWSAAAFLRGMVEDLLGVEVDAGQGRISVRPQLPQGWAYARLENLTVGRRIVNIDFKPGSAVIEPG
jgi:glycogen debranching enzyme